jgi:hypothetical protein
MGKLSPEEKIEKHNEGEHDASTGHARTDLFDQYGPLAPDSEEKEAYRSGVKNWKEQHPYESPWKPR